jgi:5,10-methylene-tetrahydrofolate dehydrogenase/methenyl tetrahydrofolate cyclohydrolase
VAVEEVPIRIAPVPEAFGRLCCDALQVEVELESNCAVVGRGRFVGSPRPHAIPDGAS